MNDATDRYQLLHELSPAQCIAMAALDEGATHQEAAEAAGVDRTTVSRWCSKHPAFRAELNQRKQRRAAESAKRVARLTEGALDAVESAIREGDAGLALHWLKLRGVSHLSGFPTGSTDPEVFIEEHRQTLRPEHERILDATLGNPTRKDAMDDLLRRLGDA